MVIFKIHEGHILCDTSYRSCVRPRRATIPLVSLTETNYVFMSSVPFQHWSIIIYHLLPSAARQKIKRPRSLHGDSKQYNSVSPRPYRLIIHRNKRTCFKWPRSQTVPQWLIPHIAGSLPIHMVWEKEWREKSTWIRTHLCDSKINKYI